MQDCRVTSLLTRAVRDARMHAMRPACAPTWAPGCATGFDERHCLPARPARACSVASTKKIIRPPLCLSRGASPPSRPKKPNQLKTSHANVANTSLLSPGYSRVLEEGRSVWL